MILQTPTAVGKEKKCFKAILILFALVLNALSSFHKFIVLAQHYKYPYNLLLFICFVSPKHKQNNFCSFSNKRNIFTTKFICIQHGMGVHVSDLVEKEQNATKKKHK